MGCWEKSPSWGKRASHAVSDAADDSAYVRVYTNVEVSGLTSFRKLLIAANDDFWVCYGAVEVDCFLP